MASLNYHTLAIFAYVTLCNCIEWNGPTSTTNVEYSATGIAKIHKQAILRRQTSALSICGFESGQAQSTIACDAGFTCSVSTLTAGPGPALAQGCCAATGGPSIASCLYYTSCADYSAAVTSDINILSCSSNAPYCQSFTYPEVDAISYGCDTTSDSPWRAVSLTSSSSIRSNSTSVTLTSSGTLSLLSATPTTAPFSSVSEATFPPTQAATAQPTPSPGPVQDLTTAQKAGIGTGCGCAFLFITWGIVLRVRRQKRESNDLPPVMFNEKSTEDQVEKVQGQESVTEEISSH